MVAREGGHLQHEAGTIARLFAQYDTTLDHKWAPAQASRAKLHQTCSQASAMMC